jgi:hypothetical protein
MIQKENINLMKKSLMWLSLTFVPQLIISILEEMKIVDPYFIWYNIKIFDGFDGIGRATLFIPTIIMIFLLSFINMIFSNKKGKVKSIRLNFIILSVCLFCFQNLAKSFHFIRNTLSTYYQSGYFITFNSYLYFVLVILTLSLFINVDLQKYRSSFYKLLMLFIVPNILIKLVLTSILLLTSTLDSLVYTIIKYLDIFYLLISSLIIVMDINRLKFKNIEKDSKESIEKYSIYSALSIYCGLTISVASYLSYYILNSDMDK